MGNDVFGRTTSESIAIPAGVARRIYDRAVEEWGVSAVQDAGHGRTQVMVWPGSKSRAWQREEALVAGFVIRWGAPSPLQATIERIGWSPARGSTEAEARRVIDLLAGWPV